jgi:hypothetical protein
MTYLIKAEGLETFELDEQGEVVVETQKEGLNEDEIDDLVFGFAYRTTEAGLEVVERMSPQARLFSLLEIAPEYYDTYLEVLDYLCEKHSMAEVDTLLRGRPVLLARREPGDRPIQASVFIDKLERAGGIVWQGGWTITDEGRELLEAIRARVSES